MIDELLKLVENGIYLFPVKITNKQPLTAHGFKDASNDTEQIKNWFGHTIWKFFTILSYYETRNLKH